jgi:hypothetical protein
MTQTLKPATDSDPHTIDYEAPAARVSGAGAAGGRADDGRNPGTP